VRIDSKTRGRLNRALSALGNYHASPGMAYGATLDVLAPEGLFGELEFVPKTGTTRVVIQGEGGEIKNSLLVLGTHEMRSGRIELTAYLS